MIVPFVSGGRSATLRPGPMTVWVTAQRFTEQDTTSGLRVTAPIRIIILIMILIGILISM